MDTRPPKSKMNAQIYEEACDWFVDFRDRGADDATRRAFDRWLRTSPEHLSAYLEIAAIWSEAPTLDPEQRWTPERLIQETLAEADNVVRLDAGARTGPVTPTGSAASNVRLRIAAGVAATLVLAGAGLFALFAMPGVTRYDTGVGEQRSVTLPDGSTVDLNARSRIEIRYTEGSRAIELLEGQALFNVAKDAARPFIVTSGRTRVRAVGTQFDVYRKHEGTMVTVVEGRVAIGGDLATTRTAGERPARTRGIRVPVTQDAGPGTPLEAGTAEILLTAGSQLLITDAAIEHPAHPNVSGAIAWRQRQLVFDSASLTEVAEEFNRYNSRQLVIEEPGLEAFYISGVFSSTDPASLIRFLRERPEVQVTETTSEIRVTKNSR